MAGKFGGTIDLEGRRLPVMWAASVIGLAVAHAYAGARVRIMGQAIAVDGGWTTYAFVEDWLAERKRKNANRDRP